MNNSQRMILIYITCESVDQAKELGKHLMNKRLAPCVNIFSEMLPLFFWPPRSGVVDESKEVVLLVKSIEKNYQAIEDEITNLHTYDTPCIFSIPVGRVGKKYQEWFLGELGE